MGHAAMNSAGELMSCTLTEPSGENVTARNGILPQALLAACNDSVFDPDPPPGARDQSGQIIFVFKASFSRLPPQQSVKYYFGVGLL